MQGVIISYGKTFYYTNSGLPVREFSNKERYTSSDKSPNVDGIEPENPFILILAEAKYKNTTHICTAYL